MNADSVLFVEPGATPWGISLDPASLSLKELRLHLYARGKGDLASGSRGELVTALRKVLQDESKQLWLERQQGLSKTHRRLKRLVSSIAEEDEEFELSKANVWKKEFQEAGAWDWTRDPRSLVAKEKKAQKEYEILMRARRRKRPIDAAKAEAEKERKRLEAEALAKKKGMSALDTKIDVKPNSCGYRERVDGCDYYCVNKKLKFGDQELRTCAFHAAVCTDVHYHALVPNANGSGPPRIKTPNEFGLCADCYKRRTSKQVPALSKHQCPGTHVVRPDAVAQMAQVQESAIAAAYDGDDKANSGMPKTCTWRKTTSKGKKLVCSNAVLKKGKLLCGYHTPKCGYMHPGETPKIEVPNALGMCRSHFTARTGKPPAGPKGEAGWVAIAGKAYPPGVGVVQKEKIVEVEHSLRPRPKKQPSLFTFKRKRKKESDEPEIVVIDINWDKYDPRPFVKRQAATLLGASPQIAAVHGHIVNFGGQLASNIGKQRNLARRALMGWKYAVTLQRWYRGCRGRAHARQIMEAVQACRRWHAAELIQAQARGMLERERVLQYQATFRRAILLLQRYARGHVTRKQTRRTLASRTIQRHVRGYLCRLNLTAHAIIAEFRDKVKDERWAWLVVVKYLTRFIFKWRRRKEKRRKFIANLAATHIQAAARRMLTRSWWPAFRKQRLKEIGAAIKMQSIARMFLAKRAKDDKAGRDIWAATCIQAAFRGFKSRLRSLLEREALEKAWRWVDSERPRTVFSHVLPKDTYGDPIHNHGPLTFWMDRELVRLQDLKTGIRLGPPRSRQKTLEQSPDDEARVGGAKPEAQKELNTKLWSKIPFLQFDDIGIGMIRRHEFGMALRQMGYRMTETQIKQMMMRWCTQEGMVNYVAFLDYVKHEVAACEKHRAWACASCVSYGPCVKCDCRKYKPSSKATASSSIASASSRMVCSCGHYIAMHNMIPKAQTGKVAGSSSEALSRSELERMLMPPAPTELPLGIRGAKLPEVSLQMHFEHSDLRVRAQTAPNGSRARPQTAVDINPCVNMTKSQATKRFQNLGQHIIKEITKESREIIDELKQTGEWNDSVNPRDTYPGTA